MEFGRVVEITERVKKKENKTVKKVRQKGNWRNGDFIFTMRWMHKGDSRRECAYEEFFDNTLNTKGYNWVAGADFHIIGEAVMVKANQTWRMSKHEHQKFVQMARDKYPDSVDQACSMCKTREYSESNPMILCALPGCEFACHKECFTDIPKDLDDRDWRCPSCVSNNLEI